MMSINTNLSAMTALQNLTRTNTQLDQVQTRINTGLKISSAKDNAAYFAIAQNMRAEVAGIAASTDSLNRAKSVVDVALAALDSMTTLATELKAKAVAASDAGLDADGRAALIKDFNALWDQMEAMASSASFNGTNLIGGGVDTVRAIANGDGSSTITVAGSSGIDAITVTRTLTTAATAAAMGGEIDNAQETIDNLIALQGTYGAAARRLDSQLAFNVKLSDATEVGIGNLVDADIARESARLQALQIKQQLGLQALSIANSRPQAILALFQ